MARIRQHPLAVGLLLLAVVVLAVWGVKLLQVKRSVGQARQFWEQPQGQAGGLLYVALGDSAAQGIGASRPERGYVGLLAERLREQTGRPVRVVNLSRSGARLDDVRRDQLPLLEELEPDLVTVSVGGNDVQDYDAATFAEHVDALTGGLPPGTLVADVPYFMHGRWERDAAAGARVLTESARARGLVPVPLHDTQRAEGWTAMFTHFSADWFHPNDRGYEVWERAFWDALVASTTADRLGLAASR